MYPQTMGASTAELLEQVAALSEVERDEFVARLIAQFPVRDASPGVDSPEWVAEIERRARRVAAGESTAEDWDVVEQRVLARLDGE